MRYGTFFSPYFFLSQLRWPLHSLSGQFEFLHFTFFKFLELQDRHFLNFSRPRKLFSLRPCRKSRGNSFPLAPRISTGRVS